MAQVSMETLVKRCTLNRANVEVLCEAASDGRFYFGVRLRFWGRKLTGKMVCEQGDTVVDALARAVDRALLGDFEALDFAKRPWATSKADSGGFE